MSIKTLAIVQARIDSIRLPGKVLKKIKGKTLIEILLYRLALAKKVDKIILATTKNPNDDLLENHVKSLGYEVFRGSTNDVLERFYKASIKYNPESIVRITGDCPLIDPDIVDNVIDLHNKNNAPYSSNVNPPTFPDGLDVEVFSFDMLKKSHESCRTPSQREHVTALMKNGDNNFKFNEDLSKKRWTVDVKEDFDVVSNVFKYFYPNIDFSWQTVYKLSKSKPEIFKKNKNFKRNEGANRGSGQKLWERAKKIIPGGNMLLSKRSEMFLPGAWPSYFSKAKGCSVWDLDGKKFIDMSVMGIGTNILGYGNPEVDNEIKNVIAKGNLSTLNCPEEVYLAEKLINIHPWAEMARFARTGGEANAIAIRIARASTDKHKVAVCGYHGWHDWYLAANLNNNTGLDNHLLPGLKPAGVPELLKGTTLSFQYNDINGLNNLIKSDNIGIIMMEVSRTFNPENQFLKKVRNLCNQNNIILIFDECTSGFRETYGGLHKKYNVNPDMAMFGKALGNGYGITALIGKRKLMESAQNTFISSTFWTERIGPVAALKTLEIMKRDSTFEKITNIGANIGIRWKKLAEKYNLKIQISGLSSLTSFQILDPKWIKIKTFITQEMLKKGFLSSNAVYVSIAHKHEIIDEYFYNLDSIFKIISDCQLERNLDNLLDGPVCHTGFKRLN